MATTLTTTGKNNLLTDWKAAETFYAALFVGGVEVSGNGYARQLVTFGSPSGGAMSNSGIINFPVATGDWGTIDEVRIYDAVTSGNQLTNGDTVSVSILNGDRARFLAGALVVTL